MPLGQAPRGRKIVTFHDDRAIAESSCGRKNCRNDTCAGVIPFPLSVGGTCDDDEMSLRGHEITWPRKIAQCARLRLRSPSQAELSPAGLRRGH